MSRFKSIDVEEITSRGNIRDGDVARLRRAFYDDGDISPDEAGALFAIHRACNVKDESWADFFVEAVTDYVVRQAEPMGYVTAENAAWLIQALGGDSGVRSKTEYEALISVIEDARWSPPSLAAFAMDQIVRAVKEGQGPMRAGLDDAPGQILETEVDLLRRIIYGFGGDGCIAVTRPEAERLFEIDAAVREGDPNPAWTELFVKAIANVVLGASGYKVPSREEALRAEMWLDERGELSPAGMVAAIAREGLQGVIGAYFEQSPEERAIARLERQRLEIVTGEELQADEVAWLCAQFSRDGEVSRNEQELIYFLRDNAPTLDARLEELVERLAPAA